MINVAINGYGRIGRNILRALYESDNYKDKINIVAINDLADIKTNVYLTKYDSVHSSFKASVKEENNCLLINNDIIKVFSERDPSQLPWEELDIDIVFECTGIFTDGAKAKSHIKAGARKVLISAPGTNVDKTIVFGVNEDTLTDDDVIVSNASCTTNCLAPIIKVIHNLYGVHSGLMTTIHSYTGDQHLVDTYHKDLYRTRAAALSLIPTKTGAAAAIGLVIPELNGKLNGMSVRVPTPNVSLVDLTCITEREVDVEVLKKEMLKASESYLHGVLGYCDEPLVSTDFNHNPLSSIFDASQVYTQEKNMLKIFSWYDNEWGFSNRMLDTACKMSL